MKKEESFMESVSVLMIAALLAKIFGAAFKIPLAGLLGGEGMGYYMTAYSVFGPVSAVALTGMTAAVSKIVAENKNNKSGCKNLFKRIVIIYGVFGVVVSVIIYAFANTIANFCGTEGGALSIKCIAPAFFFCAVTSAVRGYFEGFNNMYPTALSQVTESLFRLILGSSLAYFGAKIFLDNKLNGNTLILTSSMAVLGVTLSTAIGGAVVLIYYALQERSQAVISLKNTEKISVKSVIMTSLPICLTALASNSASAIDLFTVAKKIEKGFSINPQIYLKEFYYLSKETLRKGNLGVYLFGAYTGMAVTLFNIVPALASAFSTASIPIISESHKKKLMNKTFAQADNIIKNVLITAIFAGTVLCVNSDFILKIIFPSATLEARAIEKSMAILFVASASVAAVNTLNSIEQALDRGYFSLRIIAMVSVVKYVLNCILISNPYINIKGAAYSTLISYTAAFLLMLFDIGKELNHIGDAYKTAGKILIAGFIMAVVYRMLINSLPIGIENILIRGVYTVFYGVLYILIMLITGVIRKKDIKFLEKNKK